MTRQVQTRTSADNNTCASSGTAAAAAGTNSSTLCRGLLFFFAITQATTDIQVLKQVQATVIWVSAVFINKVSKPIYEKSWPVFFFSKGCI
jgi:hypothetical protein